MPFNRLLFIQNGLKKNSGHWLMETNEWRKAARALNIIWCGFAHVTLDSTIAAAADVKAVFPVSPYDFLQLTPPRIRKLASFIELSDAFQFTCQKHFPTDISASDLVFIGFCTDVEIFGVAKWLDTIRPEKRPKVLCMFHHLDLNWKVDLATMSSSADITTWEYSARALLQRLPIEKIRFYGTDNLLSDALSAIFKIPAAPLPSPFPVINASRSSNKSYDVGILGGARFEQGVDKWADIFVALDKLRPGLTVSAQVQNTQQEQKIRNMLEGYILSSHMDIITGPLTAVPFYERMNTCRLILLPYLQEPYIFRESGVFIQAAISGIPAVVPALTAMARHIESGRAIGVVYNNTDPSSIAEAAHLAHNNIEELSRRSMSLAKSWEERHKAENILKTLLGQF